MPARRHAPLRHATLGVQHDKQIRDLERQGVKDETLAVTNAAKLLNLKRR